MASVKHTSCIRAQTVCDEPRMVHFSDFVSPEEAEHLVALAKSRWVRSTVTRGSDKDLHHKRSEETEGKSKEAVSTMDKPKEVVSTGCTSSMVRLDYEESVVVERVLARAATVAGCPLENMEKLVLVRYEPGEQFSRHHDGAMRPMTVLAYLNDVEVGGDTFFPNLGLKIRPVLGTAIMWSNIIEEGETVTADRRMDHEAMPTGEGSVKYALNCFASSRPQRDCSHIVLVPAQGGA